VCGCVQGAERTRVNVAGILLQSSQNSHRLMSSGSAANTDVRAPTGLFRVLIYLCILIGLSFLSTGDDTRLTDASASCKRKKNVYMSV